MHNAPKMKKMVRYMPKAVYSRRNEQIAEAS
jgi:hypothetical protein